MKARIAIFYSCAPLLSDAAALLYIAMVTHNAPGTLNAINLRGLILFFPFCFLTGWHSIIENSEWPIILPASTEQKRTRLIARFILKLEPVVMEIDALESMSDRCTHKPY